METKSELEETIRTAGVLIRTAAEKRFKDGDDIEAKLRICYEESLSDKVSHLVSNDREQMLSGIAALMEHYGNCSEEYSRIRESVTVAFELVDAVSSGRSIDTNVLLSAVANRAIPIPILQTFCEVAKLHASDLTLN